MDRAIDEGEIQRTATRRRLRVAIAVLGGLGALIFGPRLLRPTVDAAIVRIATVDEGPVEESVAASGTVVPLREQVIASPVDGRVLSVVRRAGEAVKRGEAVLSLDLAEARTSAERLGRDMELKRNQQDQRRLSLESQLADLGARVEAQKLTLGALRARLTGQKELFSQGLLSREALRETELSEATAAIELQRLERSREVATESNRAEMAGLALELANLGSQRADAERLLLRGATLAEHDGVVTFAISEAGVAVRRGEVLARVADLSAFRVRATTSEVHARRLAPGLAAVVRAAGGDLAGTVASVEPSVQGGAIAFEVSLSDPANSALRPNQRLDVFVVTARREKAVRVPRGPFISGERVQAVFVVDGDGAGGAVRRDVELGVIGADFVEVTNGLRAGERVLISDMSRYVHAREIRLR